MPVASGAGSTVRPSGTGASGSNAGRAGRSSFDGPRARVSTWPPLRLARMRCERESVGVVCPPASHVDVVERRRHAQVHWARCPPRLRAGRDLGGSAGSATAAGSDDAGGVAAVRRQPGADRRGRARGDVQHARDRRAARAARRAGRGLEPAEDARDRRGEGQDRQGRRRGARAAAGGRLPAGGVAARRATPTRCAARSRAARTSCASARGSRTRCRRSCIATCPALPGRGPLRAQGPGVAGQQPLPGDERQAVDGAAAPARLPWRGAARSSTPSSAGSALRARGGRSG